MTAFPSLPLFTDAFIADTGHLSAQETGAYLMLMMVAWRSPGCRLPNDDAKLARWARVDPRTWARIKAHVLEFWTLADGFYTQKRLSKELEFVSKRAEVNRQNGKQGGRPKSLRNKEAQNPAGSVRVSETKAPNPSPNPREDTSDPKGSSGSRARQKPKGSLCPENFAPSESHYAKVERVGRPRAFADAVAGKMSRWSRENANRDIAHKADWGLALHGFIDTELEKVSSVPRASSSSRPRTADLWASDAINANAEIAGGRHDNGPFDTDGTSRDCAGRAEDGGFGRDALQQSRGGPRQLSPLRVVSGARPGW